MNIKLENRMKTVLMKSKQLIINKRSVIFTVFFIIPIGIFIYYILSIYSYNSAIESLASITNVGELHNERIANLANDNRKTIIQFLGGLGIVYTLYLTHKRIKVTEDTLKATEEGQITERFTRGIDQLGSDKIEIRLGGIYSLGRIAFDSEKDCWTIMEVLSGYIRENINKGIMPIDNTIDNDQLESVLDLPIDIEAALKTICKRDINYDKDYINLSKLIFNKRKLNYLGFVNIDFRYSQFKKAIFNHSSLIDSNLFRSTMSGAHFQSSNLDGSLLHLVNLSGATFFHTSLHGTEFTGSNLKNARFIKTDMTGVILSGAVLYGTKFYGADFSDADLSSIHLDENTDISLEQLLKTKTLYEAKLTSELEDKVKKYKPELLLEP